MKLEEIKTREDQEKFMEEQQMYDIEYADKYDKYFWCLHCEKVFTRETYYKEEECPYCGATPTDILGWTIVRLPSEFRKTEYPVEPVIGNTYPMYDRKVELRCQS